MLGLATSGLSGQRKSSRSLELGQLRTSGRPAASALDAALHEEGIALWSPGTWVRREPGQGLTCMIGEANSAAMTALPPRKSCVRPMDGSDPGQGLYEVTAA